METVLIDSLHYCLYELLDSGPENFLLATDTRFLILQTNTSEHIVLFEVVDSSTSIHFFRTKHRSHILDRHMIHLVDVSDDLLPEITLCFGCSLTDHRLGDNTLDCLCRSDLFNQISHLRIGDLVCLGEVLNKLRSNGIDRGVGIEADTHNKVDNLHGGHLVRLREGVDVGHGGLVQNDGLGHGVFS